MEWSNSGLRNVKWNSWYSAIAKKFNDCLLVTIEDTEEKSL